MRKSPEEKGYLIPVQRKIAKGKYQKAFAKSLTPNKNGMIRVCYDDGTSSSWTAKNTIHVPQGFKWIDYKEYIFLKTGKKI